MHGADQLYRWNAWLDRTQPACRVDLGIWGFAALGLVNLLFTFTFGMTFGLLLFLGLVVLNLLRLPYMIGELPVAAGTPEGAERLEAWHRQVVAKPSGVIAWPVLGMALAAMFGIGSLGLLTSKFGLPFGVLFLLAMLNALAQLRGQVIVAMAPERQGSAPMAAIGQHSMAETSMALETGDHGGASAA